VRARISGTADRPRLHVFRSLKHTYAQLIDDEQGKTLAAASDKEVKSKEGKTGTAFALGEMIAKKGKEKKISEVVFDRGGNLYHGRVKAVADGARKGGLKF